MDVRLVKRLAPFVYAAAIVLAAIFGNGAVLGAVAIVGALILGALYSVVRTPGGRERHRNRAR